MALAVTSSTLSGALSSRKILQSAGRNVRGGQLQWGHRWQKHSAARWQKNPLYIQNTNVKTHVSKQRSTLSDMSSSMQSCSRAMSCMSRSSPWPICSHSSRVSGSTSAMMASLKSIMLNELSAQHVWLVYLSIHLIRSPKQLQKCTIVGAQT